VKKKEEEWWIEKNQGQSHGERGTTLALTQPTKMGEISQDETTVNPPE